ncbi:MAG: hypothetical protein KC443_19530 [Anaerolineales bacterium]|nr:hypothetical protein [Anaerolineales bacterium]
MQRTCDVWVVYLTRGQKDTHLAETGAVFFADGGGVTAVLPTVTIARDG